MSDTSHTASKGLARIDLGDFSLTLVGRNLYTITDFLGWDPEVGGSVLESAGFGSVAGFQYPQTRTFTFTIGTRF